MKICTYLEPDLMAQITEHEELSTEKEKELAQVASTDSGIPVAECLGIEDLELELLDLDERELFVFMNWLESGVKDITQKWYFATTCVLNKVDQKDYNHKLATLLFIDAFNRADEALDMCRDRFLDTQRNKILNEDIEHTPILELNNGDVATLGDFERIVFKIVKNSKAYTPEEYWLIKHRAETFVKIATEAQRTFEPMKAYSEADAFTLRWLTVGTLASTISSLYATSSIELRDEQAVSDINNGFIKTVIAWQLIDDFLDLVEDIKAQNVNLVAGIIRDAGEHIHELNPNYQEAFGSLYPRATERIKSLYKTLISELPNEAKKILNSKLPVFLEI